MFWLPTSLFSDADYLLYYGQFWVKESRFPLHFLSLYSDTPQDGLFIWLLFPDGLSFASVQTCCVTLCLVPVCWFLSNISFSLVCKPGFSWYPGRSSYWKLSMVFQWQLTVSSRSTEFDDCESLRYLSLPFPVTLFYGSKIHCKPAWFLLNDLPFSLVFSMDPSDAITLFWDNEGLCRH